MLQAGDGEPRLLYSLMDCAGAFSPGSLIISAVISHLPEPKLRFIKIGQQSGLFDPQGGKGLVAFP